MNNDRDNKIIMMHRFAIATYAQSNDIASTRSYAERIGITFDQEQIFSDVENLFGDNTANALREWWNEARQAAFDQKLGRLLQLKAKELLAEENKASDFAQQLTPAPIASVSDLVRDAIITVTRSIQELLNPFNPAQWSSQDIALMGANRGDNHKERNDGNPPRPEIDPSLSVEDDSLIIWLRLRSGGLALPKASEAISLFIDGVPFSDFIFHRECDDTIALEAKMGKMSMVDLSEGNLTVAYKSDLSEISVYIVRQ